MRTSVKGNPVAVIEFYCIFATYEQFTNACGNLHNFRDNLLYHPICVVSKTRSRHVISVREREREIKPAGY